MDASAVKRCPFCAEEIKAEAIKCRFCGEMLDGSTSDHKQLSVQPIHETKQFVIPFPADSPPATLTFDRRKYEFPKSYIQAIGYDGNEFQRHWPWGATLVWRKYKEHFLARLNELGREGWQLGEPFEPTVDDRGQMVNVEDRLVYETVESPGLLGSVKRQRFVGAKFIMNRTTV